MKYLVLFIKAVAVFDLCCLAVYFGGDIVSALSGKWKKKKQPAELFEFYEDSGDIPLSVDSIRMACQSEISDLVQEKILPQAPETMDVLNEPEKKAVSLLLRAYIGYIHQEGLLDEQNFPLLMELLKCTEAAPEGEFDIPGRMLAEAAEKSCQQEDYFSDYQRYRLMQADKERVILACQVIINDLLGRLYRYDYRFGYDFELAAERSLTKRLQQNQEKEVDRDAPCDC